jgi:hypothetical protein
MGKVPLYTPEDKVRRETRASEARATTPLNMAKTEFLIDNLLVRIHVINEMIWWISLAPWEFEFPFSDSLISTFPLNMARFKVPLAEEDESNGTGVDIQGCLAHKKTPTPLGPPRDPRHVPTVKS